MQAKELLKQHFGHDEFRAGQMELIEAILSGRDVLGVMPTGAGKSVCYQIPSLMLPGITLVISPLISLMKDQVAALKEAGVKAAYLNSSLTAAQQREVLRRAAKGAYQLIYVAPERLALEEFCTLFRTQPVSLLAVDEAHCVSQWGQDFRPTYLQIAQFAASLPTRPVLAAFTATATAEVKKDIVRLIGLREPLCITTGFDRPNLWFAVEKPKDKSAWLKAYLSGQHGKSGIVYCATRKTVDTICTALQKAGFDATRYHAGLEDNVRRENQDDFAFDRATVMVATNAFGMGIDKSNVSFVVHYNMPKNVESYYQEAGRAGRDGTPAECILLFSDGDIQTARFLIEHGREREELDPAMRRELILRDMERLHQMVSYCKTKNCLRAALLRYFGEEAQPRCNNCTNCQRPQVREDITTQAQKILSCVRRLEKQTRSGAGATTVAQILCGGKSQKILRAGYDRLPTYGTMQNCTQKKLQAYIDELIDQGYLARTGTSYPVIRTTKQADRVLFSGERIEISRFADNAEQRKKTGSRKTTQVTHGSAANLLERLKALRMKLAISRGVPAYVVFPNATLIDMADKRPENMAQFLRVSGVGSRKAEQYGEAFLEEIRRWQAEQNP